MPYFQPPRRTHTSGFLAFSLVGALLWAPGARAADLDPGYADVPPPIPQQVVSFGSGWYIRGDLGGGRGLSTVAGDPPLGAAPALKIATDSNVSYTGSLGGGYALNNWFRFDTMFDYHKPVQDAHAGKGFTCAYAVYGTPIGASTFTGRGFDQEHCPSNLQAKVNSYDLMANGYIDLGNWNGLTPYVGAGIGLSFGSYKTGVNYFYPNGSAYDFNYTDPITNTALNQNFDKTASGNYYNLAWALMAGVSYDVYSHVKLDISYRYLNLGKILATNVASQEGRAGLRYMIDN